jgi:hypothetical protein
MSSVGEEEGGGRGSEGGVKIREGPLGVWLQGATELYVSSADEVYLTPTHAYKHTHTRAHNDRTTQPRTYTATTTHKPHSPTPTVLCVPQVLGVIRRGNARRATGHTMMNARSSRSHACVVITVGQVHKLTGHKRGAKLHLVDLAGSEKNKKSKAAGQALKEAQHINKSLSALVCMHTCRRCVNPTHPHTCVAHCSHTRFRMHTHQRHHNRHNRPHTHAPSLSLSLPHSLPRAHAGPRD